MNTLNLEVIRSEIQLLNEKVVEVENNLSESVEQKEGLALSIEETNNLIEKLESDIEDSTGEVEQFQSEMEELSEKSENLERDIENLEGEKRDIECMAEENKSELEDVGLQLEEGRDTLNDINIKIKQLEKISKQHLAVYKMIATMEEADFPRERLEQVDNYLLVVEKEDYFLFVYDDKESVCRYWVNKFYKTSKEFGTTAINKNSIEDCLKLFLETI